MKNEWNRVINADVQKHVKSSELKNKQKNYTPFHLYNQNKMAASTYGSLFQRSEVRAYIAIAMHVRRLIEAASQCPPYEEVQLVGQKVWHNENLSTWMRNNSTLR